MIEAATKRFAIERNRAQCLWCILCAQVASMAAEDRFEIVTAERQEQMAQRVDRRSTSEIGIEDGVQALALEGNEGNDFLVGGCARQHGENREQQQVVHAVALALGTARVGHFGKCGKQESKWHRATSQSWKIASIQPLGHPNAAHAQAVPAELNGPGNRMDWSHKTWSLSIIVT